MRPIRGMSTRKHAEFNEQLCEALSKAYQNSLKYNWNNVLDGKCIIVDPSSGSHTSLPAYGIIDKGVITDIDTVPIPDKWLGRGSYFAHRLHHIGRELLRRHGDTKFDLLAVELLYHTPKQNTVMESFQKLTMSIGTVHAAIDANYRIVIPPWDWQARRPEYYVKSDIADVTLMIQTLIEDSKKWQKKVA